MGRSSRAAMMPRAADHIPLPIGDLLHRPGDPGDEAEGRAWPGRERHRGHCRSRSCGASAVELGEHIGRGGIVVELDAAALATSARRSPWRRGTRAVPSRRRTAHRTSAGALARSSAPSETPGLATESSSTERILPACVSSSRASARHTRPRAGSTLDPSATRQIGEVRGVLGGGEPVQVDALSDEPLVACLHRPVDSGAFDRRGIGGAQHSTRLWRTRGSRGRPGGPDTTLVR